VGGNGAIDPADVVFFMRSAWIQSPRYAPVFWLGDQLVSWDSNDGLRSALTGALSSGLVGHAITHSDIGGYTVETSLGADMYYVRTPELLQRWSEMGAFGFGEFSFPSSLSRFTIVVWICWAVRLS
jgi:alpha-glucosidase (family GH31 glycosyl hydrolase)